MISLRRDTKIQPVQLDTLCLSDGVNKYYFLVNRLGGDFTIYIPDHNPSRFDLHTIYNFKAYTFFKDRRDLYIDFKFRLHELEACEPFKFEGHTYRECIRPCIDYVPDYRLILTDVETTLECLEVIQDGTYISDMRFDKAYGSYIHYDQQFGLDISKEQGYGHATDLMVTIDSYITVSASPLFNPEVYHTTTYSDQTPYTKYGSIYVSDASQVYYELHDHEDKYTYEFPFDFVNELPDDVLFRPDLKLTSTITFVRGDLDYIVLKYDYPLDDYTIMLMKGTKLDIPNITIYSPRIVNFEDNSATNHYLQTQYITKPMFFRSHPVGSIELHAGVTENISINLDTYKAHVEYFSIKVGSMIFKEIGRTNKGVIFKIFGNTLNPGTGSYHILNQDGELITSGQYTIR